MDKKVVGKQKGFMLYKPGSGDYSFTVKKSLN